VELRAVGRKRWGLCHKPFEDFVANWLRLRLLLAAKFSATLTLKDLFLPPVGPTIGDALPEKLMSAMLCAPRKVYVVRIPNTLAAFLNSKTDCALESNVIYTFENDNPGFDSLVLLDVSNDGTSPGTTEKSARIGVAFESRYSTPVSAFTDPSTKVEAKLGLWKRQAELLSSKCGMPREQWLFVYLAVRGIKLEDGNRTATERRKQLEADNMLILDRAAASSLFTPTLADRAFFTLDLSAEAAAAAGKVRANRSTTLSAETAAAAGKVRANRSTTLSADH
jgi:hypothetical protein